MKSRTKKIVLTSICSLVIVAIALVVHIYLVTQSKPDEHTISMARIDLKQDITEQDAAAITTWLYQQQGVSHVACNIDADNIVFTFYPMKVNASQLADEMNNTFHYKAVRYLPDAEDMQNGCPVSPNSMTYRIAVFFQKLI